MADRETALQYIHEHPEAYLQKARVDGYICPICGSGSGPSGTGITTKDGKHFTCWGKGRCYTSVDIPDIIAIKEGLQPGGAEALQRAYEIYGIPVDAGGTGPRSTVEQDFGPPAQPPAQDFGAYFSACHDRIGQTDYPQQRGLSQATLDPYGVGYDPAWRSPTALKNGHNPPASPRLIIPTGPNSYIARDTRTELTAEQTKYRKMKEGPALAFNLQALERAAGPIFIVEGEIDALSVIQAGGEAVGLGGTSGVNQLLHALEKGKPQQPLILALDKDEPGQKAEKDLLAGLDKLGIPYTQADIAGAHKDPNAALMADRISFSLAVLDAQQGATAVQAAAQETAAAAQEAERQAYMNTSAAGYMAAFKGQIAASIDTKPMRTGFTYLDGFMDGGLYEGLYCIGGGTSTGKTTLAMQIADNIAANGTDVLIFSLEMARYELMARSISRLTLVNSLLNKPQHQTQRQPGTF